MSKKKNPVTEYRNYYLSPDFPVMVLTGEHWKISDVPSKRQHFHNHLEIGICHSESGTMEFYGEPIAFKAGDISIVPRNVPHTTYSTKGTESLWSYVFVDIMELLSDMIPTNWKSHTEASNFLQCQTQIIHGSDYPYVHTLLLRIINELTERKPNYQISVRGLILVLYIEFLRIQFETSRAPGEESAFLKVSSKSNDLAIAPALNYIETHYMQQFSIDYLAELCHWSPTHFRRGFLEIMGTSPLNYLNNVRISKACNMLHSTDKSILFISESVGFHSVSSFNRYFFKTMGMSPRDYRKEMFYSKAKERFTIEEYTGLTMPERL